MELLEPILRILLHPFELILELLIAILQLLDDPGELPDLVFQPVDPNGRIHSLRKTGRCALAAAILGRPRFTLRNTRQPLAPAEKPFEESGRRAFLRRGNSGTA